MRYLVMFLSMAVVVCAASASSVERKPHDVQRLTPDEIRAMCPVGEKNPFLLDKDGHLATTYQNH